MDADIDGDTWCPKHETSAHICLWQHCPSCGLTAEEWNGSNAPDCRHSFHTADPGHQYGQIISREGLGADVGYKADPLVQEPTL